MTLKVTPWFFGSLRVAAGWALASAGVLSLLVALNAHAQTGANPGAGTGTRVPNTVGEPVGVQAKGQAATNSATTSKSASSKAASSKAALPARDLTVEFRQVEETREPGASPGGQTYSAGGGNAGQDWEPQMVLVRNGETAQLQIRQATPMQWVESVGVKMAGTSPAGSGAIGGAGGGVGGGVGGVTGAGGSLRGASVSQALQWFDAGQSLTVSARWPGGQKDVVLELEVQRLSAEPQTHGSLAVQGRQRISTTVTLPLAQWVTVAATGRLPAANTYSSASAGQVRRLLQVRVMAP